MAAQSETLLRHLHHLFSRANSESAGDAVLLERFVARRDESAFASLVSRHGPMVLGVCRRVLGDLHQAEDAFQATFLVLARKAGSLRRPETLAAWLYGTARHLALRSRRRDVRRQQREVEHLRSSPASRALDPLDELTGRELLLALDEEVMRLPENYRLPLILCSLEGRSREEAARMLGWTTASVRGRLERGRARLRDRLLRRGLVLGAVLLAMESFPSVPVSASLRRTVTERALLFTSGCGEGIARQVLTLAESGVRSIAAMKMKSGLILLVAVGLVAGASVWPLGALPQPHSPALGGAAHGAQTQPRSPARIDRYGDPLPHDAIARLGTVRFRHGGVLRELVFSPDGHTLFSAGRDFDSTSVAAWDTRTGRRRWRTVLRGDFIYSLDLSPDGRTLAVGRYRENLHFLDAATGKEVRPLGDIHYASPRLAFSPNGTFLATVDGSAPQTIHIWDMKERKIRHAIKVATEPLGWPSFSPDSKRLAFADGTTVRVWDVRVGREIHLLDPGTKERMSSVVFCAGGKLLAAATYPLPRNRDYTIHLWDMASGKDAGRLTGHTDVLFALAASPKSGLLASASRDGTIRFWDAASRKELGRYAGLSFIFCSVAFSPDGKLLASGSNISTIRLWHAPKGGEIRIPAEHPNALNWTTFLPDGRTLISAGDGQFGLWEPLTGRPRKLFGDKPTSYYRAALSPDGKTLATVTYSREKEVLLWNAASGERVGRLTADPPVRLWSCAFSPDGRTLAAASAEDNAIHTFDVASGKELRKLKEQKMASALAFSPDNAMLVSASTDASGDYSVRLWNLSTGEEVWRKGTRPWSAFELAFSPDGRILALVGGLPGRLNITGEVRLWDASTGKELRRCEGHRERVGCLAFSPDGRTLATGSQDKTIRLWEVATGGERQCLRGHQSWIRSLSFSPDNRLLASTSTDTTGLIWDLTGCFREGRFQSHRLSTEERMRAWNELAAADAARAYRSIRALAASAEESVAFLREHLPPVTAADPKRLESLMAALASERFAERNRATAELEKLAFAAEPALRQSLRGKPSLESRRRIEQILAKLHNTHGLRARRAIEVLELIATPEARRVLGALSHGDASALPTREAKEALLRLDHRPEAKP